MKDEITEEQAKAILESLNRAISTGPWDESNFLRIIGKNLQKIRDDFANDIMPEQDVHADNNSKVANVETFASNSQEIYISLYAHEGSQLQPWERLLANLPKQVVSRPIYADEEDVMFLIRSKENKVNEAYVVVRISSNDILQLAPDKIPKDRFGKPLISLKDQAIQHSNIIKFVHVSGVYQYQQGRLMPLTS